jgi:hypothetical protein
MRETPRHPQGLEDAGDEVDELVHHAVSTRDFIRVGGTLGSLAA